MEEASCWMLSSVSRGSGLAWGSLVGPGRWKKKSSSSLREKARRWAVVAAGDVVGGWRRSRGGWQQRFRAPFPVKVVKAWTTGGAAKAADNARLATANRRQEEEEVVVVAMLPLSLCRVKSTHRYSCAVAAVVVGQGGGGRREGGTRRNPPAVRKRSWTKEEEDVGCSPLSRRRRRLV